MIKQLDNLFNYRNFVWNKALETWNDLYELSLVMEDSTYQPNEYKVRNELVREKDIVQYDVQEIINRSADLEELKGELVAYFNLKEVEK